MEDNNFESDNEFEWEAFYRKGSKIIKCAWIVVIGLIIVLAMLTHYQVI